MSGRYSQHPLMPRPAPMAMPEQDLSRPFADPQAPGRKPICLLRRWARNAVFWPAFAMVAALIVIFADWFSPEGYTAVELMILTIVALSAFWIAISVTTSMLGLFAPTDDVPPPATADNALDIALLMPIYNEDTDAVFSRVRAMVAELARRPSAHRFTFYILSDTNRPEIAERERQQAAFWQHDKRYPIAIHYRHRNENIERKTGNIRDWITGWGAAHDAFITLDADSVMSAGAITRLADAMAVHDRAALIQSVPRLMDADSGFSRAQQFANNVYGGVLARGLRQWCGPDGNYWGHNAIIRTRAFAACCGLPRLSGSGATGGT
ncbi:MAG: glucans biosynthesis glucosyltransferase MdoH, partial [Pseudomonadota bacterium]